MSYLNLQKFRYFGFDESPIGGNSSGLVLACTETTDKSLVSFGGRFRKSADHLHLLRRKKLTLIPTLETMKNRGLDLYSWARSNRGRRFCRQRAAHASIVNLLVKSGISPQ